MQICFLCKWRDSIGLRAQVVKRVTMPSPLIQPYIHDSIATSCDGVVTLRIPRTKTVEVPLSDYGDSHLNAPSANQFSSPTTPTSRRNSRFHRARQTLLTVDEVKVPSGRKLENFYSPNFPSKLSVVKSPTERVYKTLPNSSKTQRFLDGQSRLCKWNNPKASCRRLYQYGLGDGLSEENQSIYLAVPKPSFPIIGEGGFGSVYIGTYRNEPVAVKVLKQSNEILHGAHSFCNELNALILNHENVVKILTYYCLDESIEIVYEYVGPTNLHKLLTNEDLEISEQQKRTFCLQIAKALSYCHLNNVLHLDVKTSNVLISGDMSLCKLSDFGCSMKISSSNSRCEVEDVYGSMPGTMLYQCPELLRGNKPTTKADVYSFGFLLWECVNEKSPFEDYHLHTVVYCVVAKSLRPSVRDRAYSRVEANMLKIAQRCWAANHKDRPDFDQICRMLNLEQ